MLSCFGLKSHDTSYLSNYQGLDVYGREWYVGINDNQQLWAVVQNKVIRNCGYYKPYRQVLIWKKMINWKNVCHKN